MEYSRICYTKISFMSKIKMEKFLLNLNVDNLAMIISESSIERWNMQDFEQKMNDKYNTILLKSNISNPTPIDIINSLKIIGEKKIDKIIVIGGGSLIDLAKGISMFYGIKDINVDYIMNCIKNKIYLDNTFLDIIAVPTTAGTGSEVTQWATIWDNNSLLKYSIDTYQLRPKEALIVPELALTLPKEVTLSTGLDALAHAIEAYWNKSTNDLIQEIAMDSIDIIIKYLKLELKDPTNIKYRRKMMEASLKAGIAFSKTHTTACHAISYPLTQLYNIPHGYAVALTLGKVSEINRGHFPNSSRLLEKFELFGGLQKWIDSVTEDIVFLRLSSFNVPISDISKITNKAFETSRINNNPVDLNKSDVEKVLYGVFSN